jgi:hypothetical protein
LIVNFWLGTSYREGDDDNESRGEDSAIVSFADSENQNFHSHHLSRLGIGSGPVRAARILEDNEDDETTITTHHAPTTAANNSRDILHKDEDDSMVSRSDGSEWIPVISDAKVTKKTKPMMQQSEAEIRYLNTRENDMMAKQDILSRVNNAGSFYVNVVA